MVFRPIVHYTFYMVMCVNSERNFIILIDDNGEIRDDLVLPSNKELQKVRQ